MSSARSGEPKRKYFTIEEANGTLPYIKLVVSDIVAQIEKVNELKQRLSMVLAGRKKNNSDVYTEELAQSQAEMEREEKRLGEFIDELTRTGVELKGPDGLCDFPSLRDGRPVYLCWRLGEPTVSHWHEMDAGVLGRQPLNPSPAETGSRSAV